MKRIVLILCFLTSVLTSNAQNVNPVEVIETTSEHNDSVIVKLEFSVASDWMVYDSVSADAGPIPLNFNIDGLNNLSLVKTVKPHLKKKYDDIFEVDLWYFVDTVTYEFVFKKIDNSLAYSVDGSFEYMSCNLTSGICLPPKLIDIKGK